MSTKELKVTAERNGKTIEIPDVLLRNAIAVLMTQGLDTANSERAARVMAPIAGSAALADLTFRMTRPDGYDISSTIASLKKACEIVDAHAELHAESRSLYTVTSRPSVGKRGRGPASHMTPESMAAMFTAPAASAGKKK